MKPHHTDNGSGQEDPLMVPPWRALSNDVIERAGRLVPDSALLTLYVYLNDDRLDAPGRRRGYSELSVEDVAGIRNKSVDAIKEHRKALAKVGLIDGAPDGEKGDLQKGKRPGTSSRTFLVYDVLTGLKMPRSLEGENATTRGGKNATTDTRRGRKRHPSNSPEVAGTPPPWGQERHLDSGENATPVVAKTPSHIQEAISNTDDDAGVQIRQGLRRKVAKGNYDAYLHTCTFRARGPAAVISCSPASAEWIETSMGAVIRQVAAEQGLSEVLFEVAS